MTAVVIGVGFAGEGHVRSLRNEGVEVVALCGRTPEPAQAMAQELGITDLRFDWRQALQDLRPDIVAITTPAPPHLEMSNFAVELGCHVMCEKPLGLNAADARSMFMAVEQAGVKHAYASSSCYLPPFDRAAELVAKGHIGRLREIEYIRHNNMSPYRPYHWFYRVNEGGGWLFQFFTHQLAQVLRVTRGQVRAAMGEDRCLIEKAPIGPTIHDFRDWHSTFIDPKQAEAGEWGEVDADTGYTVMAQIEMPDNTSIPALFQYSGAPFPMPNHLLFYGTAGTLLLTGEHDPNELQYYSQETQVWQKQEVEVWPTGAETGQKQWERLYHDFMADIRGEGYLGYPTYRDGWITNEVIDIVRSGQSWTPLPENPGT